MNEGHARARRRYRTNGMLVWVEWGGQRFEDIPAEFITEKRGALANQFAEGIIGTGLLERYIVVFDQTGGRIAYLPNI